MLNEPADNDNKVTLEQVTAMRLFIFKSEPKHAFGGDMAGSQLPTQFGSWHAIGAVAPDRNPPHELSREIIETAIKTQGFQLWRMSKKD